LLGYAVVENLFASFTSTSSEEELSNTIEAQQDTLNYIMIFYNSNRLHNYLDYKSPDNYKSEMMTLKKVI